LGLCGLQCGEFGVEDCGKLPGFNFYRTMIDRMAGIAVPNPKAAARLMAIENTWFRLEERRILRSSFMIVLRWLSPDTRAR